MLSAAATLALPKSQFQLQPPRSPTSPPNETENTSSQTPVCNRTQNPNPNRTIKAIQKKAGLVTARRIGRTLLVYRLRYDKIVGNFYSHGIHSSRDLG